MTRITDYEDLGTLRGSKYVFAPVGAIMSDLASDIESKRSILVCSTPCQIAAIEKRFGTRENLLLVEVVCHGAPRADIWRRYLEDFSNQHNRCVTDIESINFRDKRNGWKTYSLTITFKNGKRITERFEDNLYMRSFLFGYTVREACFKCPFKYPDGSHADITLGDFWGIDRIAPDIDNNLGTTLVIARTHKGLTAASGLPVDAVLCLDDVARYNRAIKSPSRKPMRYDEFREAFNRGDNLLLIMKLYAGRPLIKKLKARFKRWRKRWLHV